MACDVGRLFMCLSLLPSSVKCVFMTFAHFQLELFVLLQTKLFESSLYVLIGMNLLSDIWFANIFPQSRICLFTLITKSFAEQKVFNFEEVLSRF